MGSMNRTKWMLFIAIVAILVLALIFVYLVKPKMSERNEKETLLAGKRQELTQLQQQLAGLQTKGDDDSEKLAVVRRLVPDEPNVELLLRDLRMLEIVSGMEMSNYSFNVGGADNPASKPSADGSATQDPESAAIATLLKPVQMSFSVKGDYDQLTRFLTEVQTSTRYMRVDSLIFTQSAAPPVKMHVPKQPISAAVKLTSYYAPGLKDFFKQPVPVDYEQPKARSNPFY